MLPWLENRAGAEEARPETGPGKERSPMAEWTLNCDGASKGNPGPSGIGGVLRETDGDACFEYSEDIGRATNNIAEYKALLRGLELAVEKKVQNIQIFSDSELMVKQINKEYLVRDPVLKILHASACDLLGRIDRWRISHVRRERNKTADGLASGAATKPRAAKCRGPLKK
jgi:ribonuclease HI